jgi:hypothetical protein
MSKVILYQNTANNTIWTDWCATSSTASTSAIWTNWVGTGGSTTTSIMDDVIWRTWYTCDYVEETQPIVFKTIKQRTPSAADIVAARQAEEAAEARYAALLKKQAAADKLAEELLLANVTLKERNEFLEKGHFIVQGRVDRYRIRRGSHGNIDVVGRDGRIKHRLCAQPNGVPIGDSMLAQKLTLEHDEEHFLSLANKHQAKILHEFVLPALPN